ncbi:MAG: hypothetical protein AVDCRST_MAG88-1562 [uncultured Thermomicrobiales bacterium]|uniref:HD/PDEase domain-containing protein n=1 Tax=uncultured Thermomicrobiales bacterium TaxID=1645740 RepID=A0A6J4V0X4_9BACT|nr:MAG: hypothetical protein AVDCRST_MAG88-1562 [uncultured Thermomicrobiales bacterium]
MASPRDEALATLRERVELLLRGVSDPGRGWDHVERVYGLGRKLAREEEADRFVVGIAALLHDLGSAAGTAGSGGAAARAAAELAAHALPPPVVAAIVESVGAQGDNAAPASLEARVLRDAHRLDELGALGIAAALGGDTARGRALYDGADPFALMRELEPDGYAIDRLFARLLSLPGELHTPTARAIANRRVATMLFFLEELRGEFADSLPGALLPKGNWLVPEEDTSDEGSG